MRNAHVFMTSATASQFKDEPSKQLRALVTASEYLDLRVVASNEEPIILKTSGREQGLLGWGVSSVQSLPIFHSISTGLWSVKASQETEAYSLGLPSVGEGDRAEEEQK